MNNKAIIESASVGYEEFCRSRRVLSTSAFGLSVDNTLLDLQNSSYPTQPHSIIANYLTKLSKPKNSTKFYVKKSRPFRSS